MKPLNFLSLQTISSSFSFNENSYWQFIKISRVIYLVALLLSSFVIQILQKNFINISFYLPAYFVLTLAFFVHGINFLFYEKTKEKFWWNICLFFFDSLIITSLIYFIGHQNSTFIFLYLINIALASMVFGRQTGVNLACGTSILYSSFLIWGQGLEGQNLVLTAIINNCSFFVTALLGGFLSEKIQALDESLKKTTEDVIVLKEFNEMIVENIATGLATVDFRGKITHFNKAASDILKNQQLLDLNINQFIPNLTTLIKRDSNQVARVEVKLVLSDDTKKTIEVISSKLFQSGQVFRGYILLMQDLTEIKLMQGASQQKEKLAAVGQLAAGIAHEIRNPLASISGSIQMLESSFDEISDEKKKLMRIVLKEIDRLNLLITDFLEFVKPETKTQDWVNVNDIITDVLDLIKMNSKLSKAIEQKVFMHSARYIEGDSDKLKQAFLNIMINACQAMEKVTKPELEVMTLDKDSGVVVIIKDNGQGIEDKILKRIFEPFWTTKVGGTGLGLAITHKILTSHDAKVFVDSEVRQGTTFTVEFPHVDDRYAQPVARLA